jgi:hypothetical protein
VPSPKNPCPKCGRPKKATSELCAECRGVAPKEARPAPESFTATENKAEVTRITDQHVRTLADMIRVCEIDTNEWEIKRWVANKWEMGYKDKAQDAHTKPLFQIKVWLERKVAVLDTRTEIAALKADALRDASATMAPYRRIVRHAGGDHMLHLDIPDLHVGKLAWAPETGHESYDTKLAEQVFEEAVATLIERTKAFKFRQIVIPIGNDLLNADNKANTTTRGTVQDSDSRYQKSFGIVRRMMTRTIDRLREIAPVVALMVSGNHDTQAVWHLGDSLECYFHKTPDVTIDNAPTSRKYHQFGKVMLMFTHGDKGKRSDYPLLMATERPQMFGATTHRECHTGHLHTLRVQEHHGVRVRISPALCPPDAWHAEQGYVGNARAAQGFVWHENEGLVSLATYTVPTLASKSRKRAA